jgi:excisionase family DNA binding protein
MIPVKGLASSPMPDEADTQRRTWLTLGAASQLLGVSESTVRRWADAGEVRSYRTSGGHRRVLEEDLRQLMNSITASPSRNSDRISDIALGRVKRTLNRRRPQHATFDGFAPEVRDRLRLMGRQLVDLFARYIASDSKGDRFADDARTIGREYGRTLVSSDIGLTSAVTTFNSLRRSLEETSAQIAHEAGLSADDAVEAVEQVLQLADTVLEGIAEVYEQHH